MKDLILPIDRKHIDIEIARNFRYNKLTIGPKSDFMRRESNVDFMAKYVARERQVLPRTVKVGGTGADVRIEEIYLADTHPKLFCDGA